MHVIEAVSGIGVVNNRILERHWLYDDSKGYTWTACGYEIKGGTVARDQGPQHMCFRCQIGKVALEHKERAGQSESV